jgi:hypothetical protein
MADDRHPIVINDEKFGPMFAFAEEVNITDENDPIQIPVIREEVMVMADRIYSALCATGCDWYSVHLQRTLTVDDVYESLITAFDKKQD